MYAMGLPSPSSILPVLTDVFAWWTAQMRALLQGAQGTTALPDARILTLHDANSAALAGELRLRRAGAETVVQPLAALPKRSRDRLPLLLRLPEGMVLSRDVSLPLAVVRDLPSVVAFEINRLTPFRAEDILWGLSDIMPDRARETVSLRLSLVLRAQVEPVLAALARLSLVPEGIEAGSGIISLVAGRPRRRLPRSLWGWVCGTLALACILVPFLRQQAALEAADRAIAAHAAAAHQGEALRRQIAMTRSSRSAIAEAQRAGDALQVLALLTQALPDGTWLSDLSLRGGDLTIDGQSDNAARLMGLLAALPQFHGPSFTAPVTRSADNRTDQFSLHAKLGE